MGIVDVQIKKLNEYAVIPKYAKDGDAGVDLVATEDVIIEPGETKIVKTGLAMAIPQGYEMQIRPRSGITLKTKLRVQLGTIDAGFRGEIGVIVDNSREKEYEYFTDYNEAFNSYDTWREPYVISAIKVTKGDRIAQAVLNRVPQANFKVVEELDETERGEGGFGSSGVKA